MTDKFVRFIAGATFALSVTTMTSVSAFASEVPTVSVLKAPFTVAVLDSDGNHDSDAAWANNGKHKGEDKKEHRGRDCDRDDRSGKCGATPAPTPVPTSVPTPVPTPVPVPSPPVCVPVALSGAYVPTIFDGGATGTVSFSAPCPSSPATVSFTANLSAVTGVAVHSGTRIGLFVNNVLVSYGSTDANANFSVLPPSFFDPTVQQYLPTGVTVASGTVVDFYTFGSTTPPNCYPCQSAGLNQANRLGSATLL